MKSQTDNLVALYQQYLKLEKAIFSRIDHDDSMMAVVYKITLPADTQLILKISTRVSDYLREVYFLKFFAGVLPVPRIIETVPPEEGVHGAILMEYLPGTLLEKKDFTDELAYELGSLLARIHLNRVQGYGDLTKPHELIDNQQTYFSVKFEEEFAECSNHLPKNLLEQCFRYYEKHNHLLKSVDGPCMTHRDFRAGNVIVFDGRLQGIIDWASGRAGFAQEDFIHLEHNGWPIHDSSKKAFLVGYASIRPIPDYSVMMPLLRIGKALTVIGCAVKYGTWDNVHRRAYEINRQFLEDFF